PVVDGLAVRFAFGGGVGGETLEGHDGGADHTNAVTMGADDHLAIRGDEVVGGRGRLAVRASADGGADIVDAFEYDQPFHAGNGDHVAIETAEGTGAQTVAQHAAAAGALVEHGDFCGGCVGVEATREQVGPAVVFVGG